MPPPPPGIPCPFVKPPMPSALGHNIFQEQYLEDDGLFDDEPEEHAEPTPMPEVQPEYEVKYENYSTDTYYNIALKKSDFD